MVDEQKTAVNRAIGSELRVWRTRRGLTRVALADRTRERSPEIVLTPTQLGRLENNKRDISLSQLFALCWALDVEPDRLIRDAVETNGGMRALLDGGAE